MKLYYKINRIASAADKIIVKSYNNNVFEFNKEDFGENWEQLVNKEYELSPYTAPNLDKLQLEGEEPHAIEYSEGNKNNWFQYSRNMIRDDFFENSERMSEVDASRIVKVFNKEAIDNINKYFNIISDTNKYISNYLTNMANNELIEKVKVDFSNIKISESFTSDMPNDVEISIQPNISIVKLPPIPKSFTTFYKYNRKACYFYKNIASEVEDISNLDTSNITNFNCAFKGFINIEDFSNIKTQNGTNFENAFFGSGAKKIVPMTDEFFPKATTMSSMYSNCKNLEVIDKIEISASCIFPHTFDNCSNLKQVGNINLPNVTDARYIFGKCAKAEIGNVYAPKSMWTISGKKEGNITVGEIHWESVPSDSPYQTEEVGVINCVEFEYPSANTIYNYPLRVKAISNKTSYKPSSSGYEWWIDYNSSPTEYAKSILITNGIEPVHIKTPTRNVSVTIEFPIFNVNKDYPYTFELKTSNLSSFTPSSCKLYDNNVLDNAHTASNYSVTYNEESAKYFLSFDINDVYDGYSPILKVAMPYSTVKYTALIDDYPFTSEITFNSSVIYPIPLTFEVDEDISVSTRVEYDEDEIPNEEIAEESTEEPTEEEIVSDTIQETTEEDVSDSQTSTVVEEANTEN